MSQCHWPWSNVKGNHQWSMHAKYQVSIFNGSKVIVNVKVDNFPVIRSGALKLALSVDPVTGYLHLAKLLMQHLMF